MKIRDPYEIIGALDRLDRVEFDPYNDPVLGEKVLETKRAKLMGSWGKLMAFHKNEDKERYDELKKIQANYNDRRTALLREYKAIRSTENVDIDAIPLPSAPPPVPSMSSSFSSPFLNANFKMPINRKPPGCPQGLPPRLDELDIEDVESSEDEGVEEKKNENNLSEFLKEIEMIAGDKEEAAEADDNHEDDKDNEDRDKIEDQDQNNDPVISSLPPIQAAPPILTINPTPDINIEKEPPVVSKLLPLNPPPVLPLSFPPSLPLRPPILAPQLRPMSGVRPPHQPRANVQRHPFPHTQRIPLPPPIDHQNREPSKQYLKQKPTETKTTTIEAKPQLRNLSQDATRFLPTSLRNKPKAQSTTKASFTHTINPIPDIPKPASTPASNSKDVAYEDFMKEMQGLM